MVEEIERAFAEAMAYQNKTVGWECRDCGETFDSGRDGRQHMFSDHDNPLGLNRITKDNE